ncbi:hypothetical protein EGW08_018365 [Elysia chlorotica]|uniref:Uncharacterized protein n=1 Tax=Elysia chlorotica TaxID=188477 RepID=A0A433SX42_ELYCH|nr:hypothetical protein EGW08_018365 [Elysia chlorotica]
MAPNYPGSDLPAYAVTPSIGDENKNNKYALLLTPKWPRKTARQRNGVRQQRRRNAERINPILHGLNVLAHELIPDLSAYAGTPSIGDENKNNKYALLLTPKWPRKTARQRNGVRQQRRRNAERINPILHGLNVLAHELIPGANSAIGNFEQNSSSLRYDQWNPLVNNTPSTPSPPSPSINPGTFNPSSCFPSVNHGQGNPSFYFGVPSIQLGPWNPVIATQIFFCGPSYPATHNMILVPGPWNPVIATQILFCGPCYPATPNMILVPGPCYPATPNMILVPGPCYPATPNMILVPGPCFPATHNMILVPGPCFPATPNMILVPAHWNPATPNQMLFCRPYETGPTNFWVKPESMTLFQQSTSLAATEINPQAQIQAQQDFGMDGRGDEQVPNEQMLETIAKMIVHLDASNKQSDKYIETHQFREETNGNASNDNTSDTIFLSLSQNLNAHGIWHCCYDCSTCQSLKVNADPLGCKDKWDQAVNRERI